MSGFYIGIDGKARKIKGGYIGVDGKARKIKKGYIGVNGVARLCWCDVDPVFANNTWEQIAAACQTGNVPDTWKVGDQKTMTIGGTDYAIDIIGKNHDDYSDGSGKAPLTFQLHDGYKTMHPMHSTGSNTCGWRMSAMRSTHLPSVLALMPDGVRNSIREVNKRTSVGGTSRTIETTADKLFLLTEIEVLAERVYSWDGEGSRYEYYRNGGSVRKYNPDGSVTAWWERSPHGTNSSSFCVVDTFGNGGYSNASHGFSVSFAFCF